MAKRMTMYASTLIGLAWRFWQAQRLRTVGPSIAAAAACKHAQLGKV